MSVVRRPNRPSSPPPRERETVTHRLARLRLEQTGSLRRYTGPAPTPLPSKLFHLRGLGLSLQQQRVEGKGGHAAPASWRGESVGKEEKTRQRLLRSTRVIPEDILGEWTSRDVEGRVSALWEVCGRVTVADLCKENSALKDYVHLLPNALRVKVASCAPGYGSLGEDGWRELLIREEAEEVEETGDDDGRGAIEDEEKDEWELRFHDLYISSPAATLTTLDLSFSLISLRTLRSLLLFPTPNFPYLSTLLLTSTPNIPLSVTLLEFLSILLPLRHLSLVDKILPSLDVLPRFLPRLASATPGLETLDISYLHSFRLQQLSEVDWSTKWRELKRLGVKRLNEEEEEVPKHTLYLRALVDVQEILRGRGRKGWIDIVN